MSVLCSGALRCELKTPSVNILQRALEVSSMSCTRLPVSNSRGTLSLDRSWTLIGSWANSSSISTETQKFGLHDTGRSYETAKPPERMTLFLSLLLVVQQSPCNCKPLNPKGAHKWYPEAAAPPQKMSEKREGRGSY